MAEKMEKFVFPPNMDFVKNKSVSPFIMYVFEFTHTLDKQDLTDMWQGVMPKPARTASEDSMKITHKFNEEEFWGPGGVQDGIEWMVFKVKKRASNNYYGKLRESMLREVERVTGRKADSTPAANEKEREHSYNWPYDFWSMIELGRVHAEVKFTCVKKLDLDPLDSCIDVGGKNN
jgi:hypothetical protein